jgi:hypothetical protein
MNVTHDKMSLWKGRRDELVHRYRAGVTRNNGDDGRYRKLMVRFWLVRRLERNHITKSMTGVKKSTRGGAKRSLTISDRSWWDVMGGTQISVNRFRMAVHGAIRVSTRQPRGTHEPLRVREGTVRTRRELLLAKVAAGIHGGEDAEVRMGDELLDLSRALLGQHQQAVGLQHTVAVVVRVSCWLLSVQSPRG